MANFKIESVVYDVLKDKPDTRSDDFLLYKAVCRFVCPRAGDVSLASALHYHRDLGLPSWETVSRCRRKLQARHPELSNPRTARIRAEEEQAYVDYART